LVETKTGLQDLLARLQGLSTESGEEAAKEQQQQVVEDDGWRGEIGRRGEVIAFSTFVPDTTDDLATSAETIATPEHVIQAKNSARFDATGVDGWNSAWQERQVDFDIKTGACLKILVWVWVWVECIARFSSFFPFPLVILMA